MNPFVPIIDNRLHFMFHIGVDACLLTEAITGIGRYTHEMLAALVKQAHHWTLYSHRPIVVGDWSRENVRLRTANLPGRGLRMAWAQTMLPRWARQDGLDLFWSPTHRLPRYLPQRIARVVTIHDLVWKHQGDSMRPLSRWLDAKLMPEAVGLADRVIAVSRHTAHDLVEEIPEAADKVRVVPLGISAFPKPGSIETLKKIGIDRPYFLFVGTLEPRKNLSRLIEAFSRLPEKVKKSTLLAIAGGKGWGGVDIQAVATEWGVASQVRIVGYVSDELLATLYANALFLAMPSLYEGFGLPLVEAMSLGTPVLTSSVSSMPEVAGDAGVLVDPYSVEAIASGLSLLLTGTERRLELAQRTIATSQKFTWKKAAEQTLLVFEEAVQERGEMLRRQSY